MKFPPRSEASLICSFAGRHDSRNRSIPLPDFDRKTLLQRCDRISMAGRYFRCCGNSTSRRCRRWNYSRFCSRPDDECLYPACSCGCWLFNSMNNALMTSRLIARVRGVYGSIQASSTITNTLYNELSSYNELFAVAQSQLPFAVHSLSAITNFLL